MSNSKRTTTEALIEAISNESFRDWYREYQYAQNFREGKPWRNSASSQKPSNQHNPSQLNQCHRKIYYQRLNAPEESADPHGIFWLGTRIEEDIILKYLEWAIPSELFVGNSFWVSYEITVNGVELTIQGSTDLLVVNQQNVPKLLTEIKTRSSISDLESPMTRHKAQLHAYLYGLSKKYENSLTEGVLIYVQRKTLDIRVFRVPFDVDFWRETALKWMASQTEYRKQAKLPPGDPEYQSECRFCSYRNRCGRGEAEYNDVDIWGFFPLYTEYPRSKVREYLEAHAEKGDYDVKLTPTLAHHYPKLAEQHEVHDWHCTVCGVSHDWDSIEWDGNVDCPPICPRCQSNDIPAPLRGPIPSTVKPQSMEETNA